MAATSLLISAPARGQASAPGWPQFQGGPEHEGALSDGPPPPYRVRWTLPAPDGSALSGAVIVGDLAVTLGTSAVYGVSIQTGEVAWEVPRAGGPLSVPAVATGSDGSPGALLFLEGPDATAGGGDATPGASPTASGSPTPSDPPTPSGSPAPGDETESGSELVALDLADETERWRVPLEGTSRTGVTVDGDTAYVGDQDGTVYAIAIADGRVAWTADAGARVDIPIAAGDGLVIAVGRDAADPTILMTAFDATSGERVWRRSLAIGSSVVSAPAIGDGAVVVGLPDRFARAFHAGDGLDRWAALVLTVFSPVTAPALAAGSAFVADVGGGLYRLDLADGDRVWSFQLNELVLRSSPVVSGRTVLLGLNDGRLVAVDVETGRLVWESEPSPGLIGTIALSGDAVVAIKGGRDAGLIAFEHDPAGTLVDVPPPTELEPGTTLARFGIASVIVLALFLVPATLLRRRFGDAFPTEGPDEDADVAPAEEDA